MMDSLSHSHTGVAVEVTKADGLVRGLVVFALLLEIVVFIEPAPVDAVIVLLLGGALILGKLSFREIKLASVISLAVFGAANLISMFEAYDPQRAFIYLLVTFYLISSWVFFVGLMGRYGVAFAGTMMNAYCLAGLFSALFGILGYFHLVPFYDLLLLNGRARGLYKDCNVYGPYFVPMVLIGFTRLTSSTTSGRQTVVAAGLFGFATFALLLSFSRAAWINCGIALAVFLVGQVLFLSSASERRRLLAVSGLLLTAVAFVMALIVAVPAVNDMFAQRVTPSGLKDYDRVRFQTQELALDTAFERPLGLGPGQVEGTFIISTHSMYLRVLSENGPIALLAFIAFIATTVARAFSIMRSADNRGVRELNLIVLSCILGHLVNSLVVDTVHWRHIWFLYALPWAPYTLRTTPGWRVRQPVSFSPIDCGT